MQRYLTPFIKRDLKTKMVFLGGPRQVGKTTLSLSLLNSQTEQDEGYFSWDSQIDRKRLIEERLPLQKKLLVLDEIHKYRNWRNLVKGLYDKHKSLHEFLITGSARLDYYRRGGDSLQGRYHYYRLHPLSAGELAHSEYRDLERLLTFGGFPEPFLAADERSWRRWQNERVRRVIHEDLISLEKVQEISLITLLVEALPTRVGSPLSVKSLAEDIGVAPNTVKRWLEILQNLYVSFQIAPFGAPKIRAVKKEQKLYLWDWSVCEERGAQFENMVACQLMKYCHFVEDIEGHRMELRYLRDTDKREVDFVVLKNRKPCFAVECKVQENGLSPHLFYFRDRTPIPKFYQVYLTGRSYHRDGISSVSLWELVEEYGMA
jgi:uncharacterized protein